MIAPIDILRFVWQFKAVLTPAELSAIFFAVYAAYRWMYKVRQ